MHIKQNINANLERDRRVENLDEPGHVVRFWVGEQALKRLGISAGYHTNREGVIEASIPPAQYLWLIGQYI